MTLAHRLFAALPLCALLAAPVAAASHFEFTISGTFDVEINGTDFDKEFVISGRTAGPINGTPWDDNPVTAFVDLSSLTLSYDGSLLGGTMVYTGLATYGLLGGDETFNQPPLWRFTRNPGDEITMQANSRLDSIVLETELADTTAWLGFGGEGGRRLGLTLVSELDVVQFGEDDILGRLGPAQNQRSARLVEAPMTPIPLPAAGWLLLTAMGGLVAVARRRPA